MDLGLYARVLWRFKFVVLAGVLLACALAVLSMAKITPHGLKYRKPVVWQSQTMLLLTQAGFPEGRALFPASIPGKAYPYADPGRFSSLTALYAQLATSDPVRKLMLKLGAPADSTLTAAPETPPQPGDVLPVIALSGQAADPAGAILATAIGKRAFLTYLSQQQAAAGINPAARVSVETITAPGPASVAVPRKKTLPIVVFIAVLCATIALAFVLDNLRPTVRSVSTIPSERAVTPARRTA